MIVLNIAIYKRYKLTKIVLDYYRYLMTKYDLQIVVAGSEGNISEDIAKGLHYIEVENEPLTMKYNSMMKYSKKLNPDAVVLLGSDDIICENIVKFYIDLVKNKESNVVGFNDLYFYLSEYGTLHHYKSPYQHFGAGRFYPKSVLELTNYNGWEYHKNKGCDAENQRYLESFNVKFRSIYLSDIDGFMVDVKSNFNITSKNFIFDLINVKIDIMEKKVRKRTVKKVVELDEVKKELPIKQNDGFVMVKITNHPYLVEGTTYKMEQDNADKIVARKQGVIC